MKRIKKLLVVILGINVVLIGLFFYHKLNQCERLETIRVKSNISLMEHKNESKQKVTFVNSAGETKISPPQAKNENTEIQMLIEQLKSEDFTTFKEAADKLVILGKQTIPSLLEELKGAAVGLKGQIVFILGRIKDRDALPILTGLLTDENAYIRRNAVEALGKIKDKYTTPFLIPALSDNDGGVRERAVWALAELNDSRVVGDLMNCLINDKDERVKLAVVDALGRIKDQRAIPLLLTELKSQSNQFYKNKIVLSLREIGDPKAIGELIGYVNQLKQSKPAEEIVILNVKQSIQIAEDTIKKLSKNE